MKLLKDAVWTPTEVARAKAIAKIAGLKAFGRGSDNPPAASAAADWIEMIYGEDPPEDVLIVLGIAAAEQYKLDQRRR